MVEAVVSLIPFLLIKKIIYISHLKERQTAKLAGTCLDTVPNRFFVCAFAQVCNEEGKRVFACMKHFCKDIIKNGLNVSQLLNNGPSHCFYSPEEAGTL